MVSAMGGDEDQTELSELSISAETDEQVEFAFPEELWDSLEPSLGYWWVVVAVTASDTPIVLRPAEIRCMIRHEPMPRIEGSTLMYPDEGNLPVVDLGGAKQAGWQNGILPARPKTREYKRKLASQRDLSRHKKLAIQGKNPYPYMIQRIRQIAASALPKGATVLVATKGDEELLNLGEVTGWHFLRAEDGSYPGHHPESSEAAIDALERLRSEGAGYLLLPATSLWWLEHYDKFAEHLKSQYAVVAEDTESCVIYALSGR